MTFRNFGVREKQIEHRARREADEIAADVQRRQRIAHPGDDLGIGDLADGADRVEIELRELAIPSFVGFVGAPHRRNLIAPERPRQIGVLRDHARERNGEIESKSELFALRIRHAKNRLLRFLSRAAGKHIEIFNRRRR